MTSRSGLGWFVLTLLVWAALELCPSVLAKDIRLRKEIIRPVPGQSFVPPGRSVSPKDQAFLSGLYLIQFAGPMQPEWEQTLEDLGVILVTYVPEDTYIARVRRVSSVVLASLDFVTWHGPYRAQHKIHRELEKGGPGQGGGPEEWVGVSVMLMPRAPVAEQGQVRGMMGLLHQEAHHRFGAVFRGYLPRGRLETLGKSPAVLWIEPYQGMEMVDEVAAKIVAGDGGFQRTGMQALGYDGAGVTIAVADSGLDDGNTGSMHPDLFGRVTGFFFYGGLSDASDGHSHGTHVAGIVAGNGSLGETDASGALYGLGVAPGASIVGQRIFDAAGGYEPPSSFEMLTRDAVQAGAEIGSNSWGDDTQGRYDTSAAEFDALVRDADSMTPGDQPYILEFSAGNSGPGRQSIGAPAVAKNVIATGASQNNRFDNLIYADGEDAMADFSSRGPAEDGRIKPDVVAPGTWIASLQSSSATDEFAWGPISPNYQYQGGTSQAGPQVSGAAAVFVQYYRQSQGGITPSPALVKAALINSAVDMDNASGTDSVPNNDEGWGRVDLTRLIGASRSIEFLDQTELLTVGQVYETQVVVSDRNEPLKITLTYTDVPGFPGAIPALVNDLDLEVTGPDGRLYRGNQFIAGDAIPDAPVADKVNNVEGVHFLSPQPGIYQVRVRAFNVAQDARVDTPQADQDFALILSGNFLGAGESTIFFNRPFYTVPDQIKVTVLDPDAAGASSLDVLVTSDSEVLGESLTLHEVEGGGVFTNTIESTSGTVASDGLLQVVHDDAIEGLYQDVSAGQIRQTMAQADLMPAVITGVSVTESFGRAFILWDTDEPATSSIQYGTNTSLVNSLFVPGFVEDHETGLDGLEAGQTYFFRITATDRAGNLSTNDNGGALYQFVAPFAPAVLVVDAFFGDFFFEPPPALENYTRPLETLGVSYDIWDVAANGSPTLDDLKPFRVLMWRLPEVALFSPRPTFTDSERSAIRQYLDQGGSLFVASMEVCSRLDEIPDIPFREEILQVSSYQADVSVFGVQGVANDPITDGLSMDLDFYTEYFDVDLSDTITPAPGGVGIFRDTISGEFAGVRYPGPGINSPGRMVYLSFPFDAIPEVGVAPNNRVSFLERLLKFLAPGLNGEAVLEFDRKAYTIPSQAQIQVADSDLSGLGQISVNIFSSTESGGQLLELQETVRKGIFQAAVTLNPTNALTVPGQLRVQENDLIWSEFFDESTAQTVTDSSRIETVPPIISDVAHQAGYIDAVVTWKTTEPADTLVQYGESTAFPINRTAFNAALTGDHSIQLNGLSPDKTYFYQIISRDEAGNAAVDDNGGSFYTFNTLKPIVPPWSDSLELGSTAWVVLNEEGSQSSWTLGTPQNGVTSQAHSPVNAWAANLDGSALDFADTSLISPAIDLTKATQANLRFWHNVRYGEGAFDIWELFSLEAITNNLSAPVPLAFIENNTAGWQEIQVDLTPLAGNVVFLVWKYQLFSFGFALRPAWVIDDLSITAQIISGGTILITNNLAQGNWVLSGPLNQAGGGLSTMIEDAPPGDYTVTYGDVPFYLTPPASTQPVTVGDLTEFSGDYTFADVNTNGMSDAWEQVEFGEVSLTRDITTDTDGDGLSDEGEFVAGTNPNDDESGLAMVSPTILPDGGIQLGWESVVGRIYRIEASNDGVNWTPITVWIKASTPNITIPLPPTQPGVAFLFRVEVRP